MKIQLMNIKRQHETYHNEYEKAALEVMRCGNYIGGDEVIEFEKEFADYYGTKYAVSCGNGTDAIVLALRSLGIGPGDEVITVAWTFFATAESIAAVGATPVFVDVCEDTYCMNPKLIEKRITNKTKAILSVHFYGQSCDMDEIRKICDKHSLYLIADCAQAAGTKYKGEKSGIIGDVACFSFFPTKNLGCDGDGGMVLTNDEEIARACRSLKMHGSGKDGLWYLNKIYNSQGRSLPANMPVGESKYNNYLIGYNSRLDAIQAAILRKKLIHLDEFIEMRRNNAHYYSEKLKNTGYITPLEAPYSYHSYYLYVIKHKESEKIIGKLKEAGVGTGVYYPVPLHLQGAFYELNYSKGDLPVTEELSSSTFVIPVYPELTEDERDYIVKTLKEIDYEL